MPVEGFTAKKLRVFNTEGTESTKALLRDQMSGGWCGLGGILPPVGRQNDAIKPGRQNAVGRSTE
jgi:hypothetical protein